MYRVGEQEINAIATVIRSGRLFRYTPGGQCERFERRYARFLGVGNACMTSSGMAALVAALTGLGIGPGDEVIVPTHTYMATAAAVLAVGAIPVLADIDESITLSSAALDEMIGPRTRAAIPVHMWGQPCDMDAIMAIAQKRGLVVVEDACQGVGGGYRGRMLGSIGQAGVFSFNYYKNMTCGEGGAAVTSDGRIAQRIRCAVDCCGFFWNGHPDGEPGFIAAGSRASEIEGAMLNAQLDRLPGMMRLMRRQKKRLLRETADLAPLGFRPVSLNSPDDECASHVMWILPQPAQAERFQALTQCVIVGKTGRHTYNEWDPILAGQGGPHPALNPFTMPQNRRCRRKYSKDMRPRSLDILGRTVMFQNHPDRSIAEVAALIVRIRQAAMAVLAAPAAPNADPQKRTSNL